MINRESIIYSLRNIKNRKTRSIFTLFSIMMGITMIFIFVSFGLGLYNYIDEIYSGSSANKIFIQPKGLDGMGLDSTFSFAEDDLRTVQRTSGVYQATGIFFQVVEVTQNKKLYYTYLIGLDPEYSLMEEMSNLKIFKGRKLVNGDMGVVLGYNYFLKDKVFSNAYSLNDNIEINGKKYKIIGFYEAVGTPSDDSQIYMTNNMMKDVFGEDLSYNWIVAGADTSRLDKVSDDIEKNLRKERNLKEGQEDFYVQTFGDMIESYSNILNIVIGFIILIALISILVSAVNTANTMITSVLERVKEIGVMKSIGGTNSEIFGIFLFESSFLGFIAGVIGVLLGWILSFIGGKILENLGYSFLAPDFSPVLFIGCIAFAVLTGAISGVIPAVHAMKINPVQALRYE